jgi:ribonuclease HI
VKGSPSTQRAARLCASAGRYVDPMSRIWKEFVTFNTLPYGSNYSLEAEFIAMCEAFRFACAQSEHFDHLSIFSDSHSILHGIRNSSAFTSLLSPKLLSGLLRYANELHDLGIDVELRWVPAHSKIEGNERVDGLVRQYRKAAERTLAQVSPQAVIRNVTVMPGSLESLREALFRHVTQNIHKKKSKKKRRTVEAEMELSCATF